MEENPRRALLITDGDPGIFVMRPLSATFLGLAAVLVLLALLPSLGRKREQVFQDA